MAKITIMVGFELVELTGGGASGTKAGHGTPSAICISAPRHGSTRIPFTANRMSMCNFICAPVACGGRADRRAASAERPPRVFFASGRCMRASAYKIGRTCRGLARKFVILSTRRP